MKSRSGVAFCGVSRVWFQTSLTVLYGATPNSGSARDDLHHSPRAIARLANRILPKAVCLHQRAFSTRLACGEPISTLATTVVFSRDHSVPGRFGLIQTYELWKSRVPCSGSISSASIHLGEGHCYDQIGKMQRELTMQFTLRYRQSSLCKGYRSLLKRALWKAIFGTLSKRGGSIGALNR